MSKELTRRRETLPSLFNDFLKPWESIFDTNGGSLLNSPGFRPMNVPAVNILENKDSYEVSLAVPGMKKDDFYIDVDGNTLSISAEKSEEKEEKNEKYTRKEYNFSSFVRTFSLPEGINREKIDASYDNGLLKLALPKTDEARKAASKHIAVK